MFLGRTKGPDRLHRILEQSLRDKNFGMSDMQRSESASHICHGNLQEMDNPLSFWGLMFFTFVLLVAPQFIFPALQSLHLAKLSAGLALAAYLLDCLSSGKPLTLKVPVVRLVLGLLFVAILSIPFSGWPGGSFDALTNEFLKSILIFLLITNAVTSVRRMRLLIGSMALYSSFMALKAVSDYASGNLAIAGIRILGYEAPLTSDPNDFALLLNLILALVIGLYKMADKFSTKLLSAAVMGLLAAGVIASFSRGGFLTLLAILLFTAINSVRRRGPGPFAMLLVLVLLTVPLIPHGYGERMSTIYDNSADPLGTADARWQGMVLGFRLMLEHPFLGLGLNMHGLEFPNSGLGWSVVHSAFIQVGADLGIPGFLIYLLLFWRVFEGVRQSRRQSRGLREEREYLALAAGIETALVAYMVGGFLLPVAYRFYGFYIAGLAVALQEIIKRSHTMFARVTASRTQVLSLGPDIPPTLKA